MEDPTTDYSRKECKAHVGLNSNSRGWYSSNGCSSSGFSRTGRGNRRSGSRLGSSIFIPNGWDPLFHRRWSDYTALLSIRLIAVIKSYLISLKLQPIPGWEKGQVQIFELQWKNNNKMKNNNNYFSKNQWSVKNAKKRWWLKWFVHNLFRLETFNC